jgi:hypothetical protein
LTAEDNHNDELDNGLFCPSYRPFLHRLIRSIIFNGLACFPSLLSMPQSPSVSLFFCWCMWWPHQMPCMHVRSTPNACVWAPHRNAMHACDGHTKRQHVKHSVMGKNVCVRVCCVCVCVCARAHACVCVCAFVFDQWDHPGQSRIPLQWRVQPKSKMKRCRIWPNVRIRQLQALTLSLCRVSYSNSEWSDTHPALLSAFMHAFKYVARHMHAGSLAHTFAMLWCALCLFTCEYVKIMCVFVCIDERMCSCFLLFSKLYIHEQV